MAQTLNPNAPAGVDRETQIYEGDLFDFDYEVEPILQVCALFFITLGSVPSSLSLLIQFAAGS